MLLPPVKGQAASNNVFSGFAATTRLKSGRYQLSTQEKHAIHYLITKLNPDGTLEVLKRSKPCVDESELSVQKRRYSRAHSTSQPSVYSHTPIVASRICGRIGLSGVGLKDHLLFPVILEIRHEGRQFKGATIGIELFLILQREKETTTVLLGGETNTISLEFVGEDSEDVLSTIIHKTGHELGAIPAHV